MRGDAILRSLQHYSIDHDGLRKNSPPSPDDAARNNNVNCLVSFARLIGVNLPPPTRRAAVS